MENEYIHIIFDDHELHALLSLGTRCALVSYDVYVHLIMEFPSFLHVISGTAIDWDH